jgi:hypothetical protein
MPFILLGTRHALKNDKDNEELFKINKYYFFANLDPE